jgi:hypothetical protein
VSMRMVKSSKPKCWLSIACIARTSFTQPFRAFLCGGWWWVVVGSPPPPGIRHAAVRAAAAGCKGRLMGEWRVQFHLLTCCPGSCTPRAARAWSSCMCGCVTCGSGRQADTTWCACRGVCAAA